MPSFILTFHTFRDCRYSIQLQTEVAGGQIQTEPASKVQPSIIMKYSNFAEPPFRQKRCIVLVTQTCLSKLETRAEDFHTVNFLWITLTALRITPLHCTILLFFPRTSLAWRFLSFCNESNEWLAGWVCIVRVPCSRMSFMATLGEAQPTTPLKSAYAHGP